jgi:hypothetical protein
MVLSVTQSWEPISRKRTKLLNH